MAALQPQRIICLDPAFKGNDQLENQHRPGNEVPRDRVQDCISTRGMVWLTSTQLREHIKADRESERRVCCLNRRLHERSCIPI